MIKIKIPEHLYRVDTFYDSKGYIRRAKIELHQEVADWFYQRLGHIPEFTGPISPFIEFPTENSIIEFKLAWY